MCDQDSDFNRMAMNMKYRFKQRGYQKRVVDQALNKVTLLQQDDLLKKESKKNSSTRPYFVMEFSTVSHEIKRIINRNWGIIQSDPSLCEIFQEPPVVSYRKAPTIKDRVVRSYLPAMKRTAWLDREIRGMFKCGHCNHCENVTQTKSFVDVCTKKMYSIRYFINCKSTYVIYRLQCPCNCFYVGQTKR